MDKFIVRGGRTLSGRVRVGGAKNAVLPVMAASLLTDEEVVIRNVPNLRDVHTLSKVLRELGMEVEHDENEGIVRIRLKDETPFTAPYELVSTMRASICVLGPLLAKRGRAKVSMPGGCVFGVRPIDLHIKGLNSLGARLEVESGFRLISSSQGQHFRFLEQSSREGNAGGPSFVIESVRHHHHGVAGQVGVEEGVPSMGTGHVDVHGGHQFVHLPHEQCPGQC